METTILVRKLPAWRRWVKCGFALLASFLPLYIVLQRNHYSFLDFTIDPPLVFVMAVSAIYFVCFLWLKAYYSLFRIAEVCLRDGLPYVHYKNQYVPLDANNVTGMRFQSDPFKKKYFITVMIWINGKKFSFAMSSQSMETLFHAMKKTGVHWEHYLKRRNAIRLVASSYPLQIMVISAIFGSLLPSITMFWIALLMMPATMQLTFAVFTVVFLVLLLISLRGFDNWRLSSGVLRRTTFYKKPLLVPLDQILQVELVDEKLVVTYGPEDKPRTSTFFQHISPHPFPVLREMLQMNQEEV